MKRKRFGEILIDAKLIEPEQLLEALEISKNIKKRLGDVLVEQGWVTTENICSTLSEQLNIPLICLKGKKIEKKVLDLIPAKFCHEKRIIPLGLSKSGLWIAMADPTDYGTVDDISFLTDYHVKVIIAEEQELLDQVIRSYPLGEGGLLDEIKTDDHGQDLVQLYENIEDNSDIGFEKLKKAAKGGVIRQLTNGIIVNAIKQGASDIHIEPQENDVAVRYRVDGALRDIMNFEKPAQTPSVSRLKIMANLDITIRRRPQDGRAKIRFADKIYDLRVSSLPTLYGEKVVIRVLESQLTLPISEIGLPERELDLFKGMLARSRGLILVTGPTGCGKTTTLYAALHHIYSQEINIVTIEDPIEYSMPGINQVQVNPATGLTFAKGLRSLLRQDPNVVMIGEIRDQETASIAIQAAQTGHLVLSSLHTNDAPSAVVRLLDLGIEPYVISSSLLGVLSQRLVRKIHEACKTEAEVDSVTLAKLPLSSRDKFWIGKGCTECQSTGYKGRIGIYELLTVNEEIGRLIVKCASATEIAAAARKNGMISMIEDGIGKARRGITSLEDFMKTAISSEAYPAKAQYKPAAPQISQRPELEERINSVTTEEKMPDGFKQVDSGFRRDRIMVVDDDETLRRYLKKILEDEYYEVILAFDGKDAMRKIQAYPPDLIIVDYMMPEMNGIEFIQKLKSHSRLSQIPIIMQTVTDSDESEIEALSIGADDWIQKPINRQRLLLRIKRILKAKK